MSSKTFNLSLPEELVKELDRQAKRDFSSRSDYVRKAIVNQLRMEQNLKAILDDANAEGKRLGITSEQQVYDIIAGRK
ncbi:MAG: ribbon-helix-helix domain-containing protein [Patescibacteria group bacterium]|mgnify:FL=1